MVKQLLAKLAFVLALSLAIVLPVQAARTDQVWDNFGTYTKTTSPSGLDVLINGLSKYLNFGSTVGTSGYGFRDNAGSIEFKHSGGSWAAIGTGGGGGGSATTTINGMATSSFTFAAGNKLTVASSSGNTITYSLTTSSISQFLNDSGYVTSTGSGLSGGIVNQVLFYDSTTTATSSANLYWASSTSRLGIGTTQPSSTLHAIGVIRAGSTAGTNNFITIDHEDSFNGRILSSGSTGFYFGSVGGGLVGVLGGAAFGGDSGIQLKNDQVIGWTSSLGFANLLALSVDGTALQLGNDAATTTAQVIKAADGSGTDRIGANLTLSAGIGTGTGGSGNLFFNTASASGTSATANVTSTRMTITAAGRVGVGTQQPSSTFHVVGETRLAGRLLAGNTTGDVFANNYLAQNGNTYNTLFSFSGTTGGLYIDAQTSYAALVANGLIPIDFKINGTQAMRLDANGNLGIGTISQTGMLQVASTTYLATDGVSKVGIGTVQPSSTLHVFGGTNQQGTSTSFSVSNSSGTVLQSVSNERTIFNKSAGAIDTSIAYFNYLGVNQVNITAGGQINALGAFAGGSTIGSQFLNGGGGYFVGKTTAGTSVAELSGFTGLLLTGRGGAAGGTTGSVAIMPGLNVGSSTFLTGSSLFNVGTSSTDIFRVLDTGRVGIGTTQPSSTLHVNGSSTFNTYVDCDLKTNSLGLMLCGADATAGTVTWLANGSAYLSTSTMGFTAGANITITTSTTGVYTIASTGGGGGVATTTAFSSGFLPMVSSSLAITNSILFQDVANSRLGISTIQPSSTLHIVGTLTATATTTLGSNANQVNIATNGNDTTPGLIFEGNTGSGISFHSSGMYMFANGAKAFDAGGGVMHLAGNFLPDTDAAYSLGSNTFGRWAGVFTSGASHLATAGGFVGIGTQQPSSTLHVVGSISLSASSTVSTPSIGGGALLAGACSKATSTIDSTVTSSTAAFDTTPKNYPGDGVVWDSYLTAPGELTTRVCAVIAVTPTATAYNVKIFK